MKVTYNWLEDFVDIALKPQELADTLTMAGLEVTSQDRFEDDYVFEIEVTSNRPDWLSVIGIAREVAALTGKKYSPQSTLSSSPQSIERMKDEGRLVINIEDKNACPFYSARIIRNVKVKASPKWLVKRLQAIGLRPINNIVDITNYVLFTTGQPLHAFDLDKIVSLQSPVSSQESKIVVRRARNGEEIVTIDGIKRKLTQEILLIANENNPVAIAGIMGGKESEVNEATQNILLESAYFSPIVTRRVSRLLGLSSDSSYRFERSVDKSKIIDASNFASSLILESAGGQAGSLYKSGSDTVSKKIISFDIGKANKLIGQNLPIAKIKSILKALEFKIMLEKKNILKIEVPAFRQDIKSQADLTEELCRISGYGNVPLTLPAIKPQEIREDKILLIQEAIRELLAGIGLSEAITYSLLSPEMLQKVGTGSEKNIRLENPLSIEQEILRPTLIVGLLHTLRRNLELGNRPGLFFEIGDCFSQDSEFRSLSLMAEKCPLSELKGTLELLLQKLGIKNYKFSESASPTFQEGQSAVLIIEDKEIGLIGQLKKEILLDFKIDSDEVMALEINLDKLKSAVNFQKTYQPLPKYPSVMRDVSLIVDEAISYQKISEIINASKVDDLEAIRFKDMYHSEAIGKGKKSLTLSLEFRSTQKTLTDVEVNDSFEKVVRGVSLSLGASVR